MDKLKALWAKFNVKIVAIALGAVFLIIKFRQVIIDILVSSSKTLFENTQKTSDKLQAEEKDANDQANALVKKVEEAPNTVTTVSDDWNTEK